MQKQKKNKKPTYKIPKIRWLTKKETANRFGRVLVYMIFFGLIFVGIDALVVLITSLVG